MNTIEEKILKILKEEIPYEVIGGPTTSETLKGPLDYTKPVSQAHVPQATPTYQVGQVVGDAELREDEDEAASEDEKKDDDDKDDLKECDTDDDKKDDKGDKKDDLEETFAMLLRRLVEEDEDDKKDDDKDDDDLKEDEPKVILPTVDSLVDEPAKLLNQAPGAAVIEDDKKDDEDEDDSDKKELDEDEPKIILPDVDSLVDEPSKLLTQAPGAAVIEDEDKDDKDKDKDDKDQKDKDDKKKDFDFAEDMKAIFSGAKLSEGVKAKVATIFKAAVVRRVNEEKVAIAKKASGKLTEAFTTLKTAYSGKQKTFESKLSTQLDSYLNYVVENWMTENRLAVERGIRAELAENFITGLKKLFVENYIEVPQSKVDVVATLGNKVNSLEKKLNETLELNIQMRGSLNTYRKDEVVRSVSAGLTDTQGDKFAKLAEGVEYTTRKEFAAKLQTLKESYFPKVAPAPKREEPLMEAKKVELSDEMAQYSNAISKSKK
jgi:hypothetical protein